jgi:uncharacterized protein (TIGR02118 family)
MIKLTVLYNLPPDADHEAFVKWRTESHQQKLVKLPGLIETTFYVIQDSREGPAPYRYMSELFFPDQETFEKAFYDPGFQAGLKEDLKHIVNPLFLVSRQLLRRTWIGSEVRPSK